MKDQVLVEFVVEGDDYSILRNKLDELGDDFIRLKSELEFDHDNDSGIESRYIRLSGLINSDAATALRLSSDFISDRMRISYIPEDLKNKYRK